MARNKTTKDPKQVETLTHDKATRRNIPTAELSSIAERMEEQAPFKPVTYERTSPLAKGEKRERDEDLDPQLVWKGTSLRLTKQQIETLKAGEKIELGEAQLVWRGKDQQDWSDLVVQAPPLYIQEKVHPKAIIEDLKRQTKERKQEEEDMFDLFGDFNGLDPEAKTEFYQHNQHWQNRMILGDSLQVMASLAERENLRGKVQCIYFDPPYGIKFNSNWQVSTRSKDVKDGKLDQITREPEQVKAFRDTWKNGIHSYLTYLRDRLTSMRDLLDYSGSIFVQIGDENVHKVRSLMDEIFGEENFVSQIVVNKTSGLGAKYIENVSDYILWYARSVTSMKIRKVYRDKIAIAKNDSHYKEDENGDLFTLSDLTGQLTGTKSCLFEYRYQGKSFKQSYGRQWKTTKTGIERLEKANRIEISGKSIRYKRFLKDFPVMSISNEWADLAGSVQSRNDPKVYVVQSSTSIVARCIHLTTDPGDIVLDPTCGSGTTATSAEQWGRRWITIDTSRVALALARTRLMSAKYPYYILADSNQGIDKEQKVSGSIIPSRCPQGDIRQGFVYERYPKLMLKSFALNAEIDIIWEKWQETLEPLRKRLNQTLSKKWEDWDIPKEPSTDWPEEAKKAHIDWWAARIKRQEDIDKSIAQKADVEYLYDRPYEDPSKVRVAGPFTVESLSPHRVIPADDQELIDDIEALEGKRARTDTPAQDFATMVLENLKSAGVHQSDKQDRISFTAMEGWPGEYISATGTYEQDSAQKKAAIFIGPEFGSITRSDIMAAAREANEARFDVLIACGFNFDAHSSEINKLGPLPILKAKINPDLHMADDLKNTGKGNLFVVFGEPDIEWDFDDDGNIIVEVLGIDVFDPKSGEVRASGKDDIAAWFIDTDYNEESFFVRHAYFMGANDPYKALKNSLKAEIDKEAWATLYRDKSRPFARPETGRFAVKVINHFGDEVMKVFGV